MKELWAVEGKHNDIQPSATIMANLAHFRIWTCSQCMENGKAKFNLDFLGRWRLPEEDTRPEQLEAMVGEK